MRDAFELLFEESSRPMWVIDADERILLANPLACRLLDKTLEEMLKLHVADLKIVFPRETREISYRGVPRQLMIVRHEKPLLSKASHDMRNPLSVILAYSHLIRDDAPNPKIKRQVEAIRRSAESIDKLIEKFAEL